MQHIIVIGIIIPVNKIRSIVQQPIMSIIVNCFLKWVFVKKIILYQQQTNMLVIVNKSSWVVFLEVVPNRQKTVAYIQLHRIYVSKVFRVVYRQQGTVQLQHQHLLHHHLSVVPYVVIIRIMKAAMVIIIVNGMTKFVPSYQIIFQIVLSFSIENVKMQII